MAKLHESYRKLRKNAYRSYWERRILSEIGYLIELLYEEDKNAAAMLDEAVDLLDKDFAENKQIGVQTAKHVEEMLAPLSEKAKSITIICAAHAHIDMNWLWGYQETVAVVLDTVRTMLTLMDEYPAYTFSQSQASIYRILEQYSPALLAKVKQRVKEGRWEVTASSWVENDKNMADGESMAKHLLYAKRYLSKLLDIPEASLNLDFEPDTFGHSYNLPEILNNGGVSRYYHCRGYDGENIYRWRGQSGAEILAYREPRWYGECARTDMCEGYPTLCKKYGINKVLYVYGVGDHGGGPTRRDIEDFIDMNAWPLFPEIKFGTYREFYDYLEEHKEQFPIVDQELNYVFTGCYTSQSRIKMANRLGEMRLLDAEALGGMAKLAKPDYEAECDLEEAWRMVLFNHFHDILPGSGVVETREYALGKFQEALAVAGANAIHAMDAICANIADGKEEKIATDRSLGAGVGNGVDRGHQWGFTTSSVADGAVRYMACFNTTQVDRNEPVEMTLWDWKTDLGFTRITDMQGNEYPFQCLESGGYWAHDFHKLLVKLPVPAMGYTVCRIEAKMPDSISIYQHHDARTDNITDEPIVLENDQVKAVFDAPTMKCTSFVRKSDGMELVNPAKPTFGFALITEETSAGMTAWRVGKTADLLDLNENCCVRPGSIQLSGMRKKLSYEITRENIKLRVGITLDEGSSFLKYHVSSIWTMIGDDHKGIPQLRFMAPFAQTAKTYRYAIPAGMIDRAPLAQDVPALGLGCAVLEDEKSAFCLMSDCKYGFRGDRDGLSLDLLRSSNSPDGFPEYGEQTVTMAIGVCEAEEAKLALEAARFEHPVVVRSCAAKPHEDAACRSLLRVDGAVVSTLKVAEDGDGFIVRLYNPAKESGTLTLSLPGKKIEAYRCDILENNLKQLDVENENQITDSVKACEVCSFRLKVIA